LQKRLWLSLSVVMLLVSVSLFAQSSDRWVLQKSEHLLVAIRSDLPTSFFETDEDTLDAFFAQLEDRLVTLETDFRKVEQLLQADYQADRQGHVPVLIYPNLEAYQEAATCLICAAHIGRLLSEPSNDTEPLLGFGAHLNLDSSTSTIFHEFAHIVDFASIPNGAVAMWYEGLASYVGNTLLGERGQPIMDVLPQYLKQYQQTHGLTLADYLTRPNYGRWTYNLGTNLIEFLVEREGMTQFMSFYRALNHPELGDYDRLFQQFYGMDLAELEREWQAQIDQTEITETGRVAFQMKFDQIVLRWVYLRSLLKNPERLNDAYLSLWEDGEYNFEEAQFMREYLADYSNMTTENLVVADLLQNTSQMRSYVSTYSESFVISQEIVTAVRNLETTCANSVEDCAQKYFNIVHEFIRWQ